MKHWKTVLGFVALYLVAVGLYVVADTTYSWSDGAGARGTLTYTSVALVNPTITGGNVSGETNANATLTTPTIAGAAISGGTVSGQTNTTGVFNSGTFSVSGIVMTGGKTFICTNVVGTATNLLYYFNGMLTNTVAVP